MHVNEPCTDYRRLNFRIRKPDIRNLRFRFALRQVIVLTPCLVLAYLWQTNNIYWLVISVFFMMIPFTEYTMQRVRQRVFGTMAGIVLSFILFTIFPDFTSRVVIMTTADLHITWRRDCSALQPVYFPGPAPETDAISL